MDFKLDIAKIVEAEEKDPTYSFFKDAESMDTNPRFSALNRICTYVGTTYEEFIDAGFSIGQLAEILEKCLENAGFRSDS